MTMRKLELVSFKRPVFQVRVAGLPQEHGYGVLYLSGAAPELAGPDEWVDMLHSERDGSYLVRFGKNPLVWSPSVAESVVAFLREVGIETEVRPV